MENRIWAAESIRGLLKTSDKFVERSIVKIFERQTDDEQYMEETKVHNKRGFSSAHARRGSYYAKWIIAGKHLTGKHIEIGRRLILHYVKQWVEVANNVVVA